MNTFEQTQILPVADSEGKSSLSGPADASVWRELVLRMAARLPPADLIQLPQGGHFVVRRRSTCNSTACVGSRSMGTQFATRQLRQAASCPMAGMPAAPGQAPPQGAPAGWDAAQERRYQRQLAALRHAAGRLRPAQPEPASSPVSVPCKAGQGPRSDVAASLSFSPGSPEAPQHSARLLDS